MTGLKPILAVLSTTILLGMVAEARAESVHTVQIPQLSFTTRDAFAPDLNQWSPQVGRRSLEWDSKAARWGFKLDVDPLAAKPLNYTGGDMRAGAYYKITPALRVGGAVHLGPVNDDPRPAIATDHAPKVRLETAFKF